MAPERGPLVRKAVIEIKPPNFNKGVAVCELMKSAPFAQRIPLFVGDDVTDESVFAVMPALGGFGYSVGREVARRGGHLRWSTDATGSPASATAAG
jgi:trehalose 6-phosphate phosphatase